MLILMRKQSTCKVMPAMPDTQRRPDRAPRSPGRPKASDGLDTREVLKSVGLHLFATRGYAGVAVSEIAGAAGVSAPVIYQRFGSKAGLFVAIAEDCYARGLEHLRPLMEGVETFEAALDAVLQGFASLYRIDREVSAMVLTVLVEVSRDEGLAQRLQGTMRSFRAFFDGVAELAPPELAPDARTRRDLSRALVALSSGLTSSAVIMPDGTDYTRMVDAMRRIARLSLTTRPALDLATPADSPHRDASLGSARIQP